MTRRPHDLFMDYCLDAMPYTHTMPVRFADTDAQGHMYFANYLTFCDEALAAYMRHIGCPWQELVASGVDMVYASARCDFTGSATFEMPLAIEASISRIGTSSVTSVYRVCDPDGALLARAELVSVCVDATTKKKTAAPQRLRDAVREAEAQPFS